MKDRLRSRYNYGIFLKAWVIANRRSSNGFPGIAMPRSKVTWYFNSNESPLVSQCGSILDSSQTFLIGVIGYSLVLLVDEIADHD